MKVIINYNTSVGGIWYEPQPFAQNVPDSVAAHLIEIGSAVPFETKVVEVTEKKTSSASPADPASPPPMQPTRRGRKPKSSQ
jgi:hypothetical protein